MIALLSLASCGGGPLSLLTGGGPNVAANVQAGKTNTQTLGNTSITENRIIRPQARTIRQGDSRVTADEVRTVVVNESPMWLILLAVIGWLLPSPGEIGRQVTRLFRKG